MSVYAEHNIIASNLENPAQGYKECINSYSPSLRLQAIVIILESDTKEGV